MTDLTEKGVKKNALTTLMITHNMEQAIRYENRLIMMHEGRIIPDVAGEDKLPFPLKSNSYPNQMFV